VIAAALPALCPPEAIHLELADLVIDRAACTGCQKCVAPCPVGALSMVLT
jgi:Fe-S-cluster-containing hydrogenase component 2